MRAHRLLADHQGARDLTVGSADGEQIEDLALAFRQAVQGSRWRGFLGRRLVDGNPRPTGEVEQFAFDGLSAEAPRERQTAPEHPGADLPVVTSAEERLSGPPARVRLLERQCRVGRGFHRP